MSRRHDPRKIKNHLTYTASELAMTLDISLTTVRHWTAKGLNPIDRSRPFLFAPHDIKAYIKEITKPRQPLAPGEIYCVACKVGRRPNDNHVIYRPRSVTVGDLIGECPACKRKMFRRTRLADLIHGKFAELEVRFENAAVPISANRDAS